MNLSTPEKLQILQTRNCELYYQCKMVIGRQANETHNGDPHVKNYNAVQALRATMEIFNSLLGTEFVLQRSD